MSAHSFIEDGIGLLSRNAEGCRYLHFRDGDLMPDYMFDFVFTGRIKLIGGVFNRNLGAVVFEETPKHLSTLCFGDTQVRHQKVFDTDILAVKVGQKRIITLLADKFYIHTNIFHSLQQGRFEAMPPNPNGIYSYVSSERLPYFACPWYKNVTTPETGKMSISAYGSITKQAADALSSIAILNIESRKIQVKIPGTEAIAALAFSSSGTRLAAANASGMEFRIYESKCGRLVAICNRGSPEAIINSLLFSDCENYLLSTSNQQSVHLFPVLPVPAAQEFAVNKAEPLCVVQLLERVTGTGSIMSVKSLMNMHEDCESLRVIIVTATNHMHLYVIKAVPATCFLGAALTGTKVAIVRVHNLLEEQYQIRRPFLPYNMKDSAYDATDDFGQPAEGEINETKV